MQSEIINNRKYELLLAAVISARATSFIFSKIILQEMSPFNLLAVRFLLTFGLLVLLFYRELRKLTKKVVFCGVIIGLLFFITMALEMLALEQADSSLVSLLENCAVIFVPLFEIVFFRKYPSRITVASIATALHKRFQKEIE